MVVEDERSKLALCITAGTLQNAAHDCTLEKVVLIEDHRGSLMYSLMAQQMFLERVQLRSSCFFGTHQLLNYLRQATLTAH